ncbi:MAG: nickel/cobalt transporter [Pseudomonadota bacterium]
MLKALQSLPAALGALFLIALLAVLLSLTGTLPVQFPGWGETVLWLYKQQQAFHKELTGSMQVLAKQGSWSAGAALIVASFLYGVFHAAGPGHGKAVLTTYLLTNPEETRRGIMIAWLAALCQGLVAISLIYGLLYIAGWVPRDTKSAVTWSERLSYILVMGIGVYLIWRVAKARNWIRHLNFFRSSNRTHHQHEGHDHHSHDHAHDHNHHNHDHSHHDHDHHHHHGHSHDENCGCGHAHSPDIDELRQPTSLKAGLGLVLSMGLRPCSGAILVLVFAKVTGLALAGVLAVLAMSVGTAIAISILAIVAIQARDWTRKALSTSTGSVAYLSTAADIVTLLGGVFILMLGYSLFIATYVSRSSFGL